MKKSPRIYIVKTHYTKTHISTRKYFKICYFTVKSLKGCNNSPKGSLALFNKACVCGIFVKVHRNELQKNTDNTDFINDQKIHIYYRCR